MNLADRILHLRKARGISQEELADKIGVSRQAVSKWESEQSVPDIEKIILLSDYFETTTDYLLKGIEPIGEPDRTYSATVFSIIGTTINAMGLVSSIAIWLQKREPYSVGIGLVMMLLGTAVFLIGQAIDAKDRARAKRLFVLPNIWILLLIPLSCCFNLCDGLFGGFYGELAPVPMLSNSFVTFGLCWVIYAAICITVDLLVWKKGNGKEGPI